MANRRRWAALRYARLIAEVKRDTEVAAAVDVGASNTVSQIANGEVTSVSNTHLTSTYVSNTDFQSFVANTNAYIASSGSSGGDVANSYLTSTYVANTSFQLALANTNAYIASVDTAKLETTDVDYSMMLTQQGTLSTTTGTARWYAPYNLATNSIKAYVETAPVGSAISIDIKKNGTSAATPSISDGGTSATEITSAVTMNAGDYLTVDITAVGSTTAGANLNIVFKYKRT